MLDYIDKYCVPEKLPEEERADAKKKVAHYMEIKEKILKLQKEVIDK